MTILASVLATMILTVVMMSAQVVAGVLVEGV